MAQSNWEADKMLDVYIYDYLLKRNLQTTAKAFMAEGKVAPDPVAIDAPGGFLFEWWSVFWDIFIARTNEKHSEVAAAYIETQQLKAREQQQLQMQQLQFMQQRQAQLQRTNPNHPSLSGPMSAISSDGIMGGSAASVLAAKLYEERLKNTHSMDSENSPQLLDPNRMALLKSPTSHPGQLAQSNAGAVSAALQQIQARNQQANDIKGDGNLALAQRSLPVDPSSIYGQGIIQSKSGLGAPGLNQGVSGLPLKGWPLTGIDQIRPNIGPQMQKPFLSTQSQFQLLSPQQQQQYLAQAQVQGNLINSPNFGDMDPRRFRSLPRGNLSGKDGQPAVTDGSVGSPMQTNSPKVRPDQAEYLMKMKVGKQQSSQQPQEQLQQQQQLQQSNRKRKQATSSGPANSNGTGNTLGPSNSQPSTPSTHTTGEGVAMAGSMQHANSLPKGLMMYGTDVTGGIAASSNQMVVLWNMETLQTETTAEEHTLLITDVRFRPGSMHLATSSFDRTVRLWNAADDGATAQVRFQPRIGQLLAAAAESIVTIFDVESDRKIRTLQSLELWNMVEKQTRTVQAHDGLIPALAQSPFTGMVASASHDKSVKLWK
ncbi:Transcriptional corepressor LEUNIG [Apostasia shenzhenica]|uniref:Transcriptional corepressor LEUNIG n=1 Tax=Apostasia shenzhenica TaxID=1088818 RepID=A0A2I0ACW2_9ASPA|nr:Transcriptional corepressor LEUNIG [Apostasia shenzhenica]